MSKICVVMKVTFFISSVGDTDLALKTIKAIEHNGQHETIIISLTKAAQQPKEVLQVSSNKSLVFANNTTQSVEVDAGFLNCLLTELKQHPSIQVRLDLHPGIHKLTNCLMFLP